MKPPKFHRGQAVTPNGKTWTKLVGNENVPKFGEIYHIDGDPEFYNVVDEKIQFHGWYVQLVEFPGYIIHEDRLDPVDLQTSELQELIATPEPQAV